MRVFNTENEYGSGTVFSWASILDDNARAQAEAISRTDIVDGPLALMPDAHFGYGPPVGSAFRMRGGVMPYAVGVDIGCGMIAMKTTLHREELRGHEGRIHSNIRELIPSGLGKSHAIPIRQAELWFSTQHAPPGIRAASTLKNKRGLFHEQYDALLHKAQTQFGTLGSGNHFVEVCQDKEEAVWLLLHSGSRGIGLTLANAHIAKAKQWIKDSEITLENSEFSYFMEGSLEFHDYIEDMLWAQRYALAQRQAMMDRLIEAVDKEVSGWLTAENPINCHHNYAELTEDGAWLVRKGAIDASEHKLGIIPGSMGTATYIVEGLGNSLSYNTSPHGAGRIKGRGAAKRELSIEEFKEQMGDRTWQDRDAEELLDEAPKAYKPIAQVIEDSRSLIKPVTILSQFINYKGVKDRG